MAEKMTNKEIMEKLKWFHGEEFEKYPFIKCETERFKTKQIDK